MDRWSRYGRRLLVRYERMVYCTIHFDSFCRRSHFVLDLVGIICIKATRPVNETLQKVSRGVLDLIHHSYAMHFYIGQLVPHTLPNGLRLASSFASCSKLTDEYSFHPSTASAFLSTTTDMYKPLSFLYHHICSEHHDLLIVRSPISGPFTAWPRSALHPIAFIPPPPSPQFQPQDAVSGKRTLGDTTDDPVVWT
jgi:hypothetical protein